MVHTRFDVSEIGKLFLKLNMCINDDLISGTPYNIWSSNKECSLHL